MAYRALTSLLASLSAFSIHRKTQNTSKIEVVRSNGLPSVRSGLNLRSNRVRKGLTQLFRSNCKFDKFSKKPSVKVF